MAAPELTSQFDEDPISSLCALGPRPLVMSGFIRYLLIQHFSQNGGIEDPCLQHLIWQGLPSGESDPAGGIVIDMASAYDPDNVEKRPAIYIKRNALRTSRLGINNEMLGLLQEGSTRHEILYIGSHTLFCLAGEDGEAEKLATEVARELMGFSSVIRRELNLIRFELVSIDELHQVEESTTNFAIPVTLAYAYTDRWTLRPFAPALKNAGVCCGCTDDDQLTS